MRVKEVIIEGSDIALLYHSTSYTHAAGILKDDGFKGATTDHNGRISRDSYISFSRSPSNMYNRGNINLGVTFEINQEKLEKILQSGADADTSGRQYGLKPFVFHPKYVDELETRCDMKGCEKLKNLKKFVRAIHVLSPDSVKIIADAEAGLKDIPAVELVNMKKHAEKRAAMADDVLKLAAQKGLRTHVYLNRADWLNKRIDKSFTPQRGKPSKIWRIVKALVKRNIVGAVRIARDK